MCNVQEENASKPVEGGVRLPPTRVPPIRLETLQKRVNAALPSAAPAQQAGGKRGDGSSPMTRSKGGDLRDRPVPLRLLGTEPVIVAVVAVVVVPIV